MNMITFKHIIFAVSAGAALLAGCAKEEIKPGVEDAQTPVNLVAAIQQAAALPAASSAGSTDAPHTRTATGADGNTTWATGDAVGVIMFPVWSANPSHVFPDGANVEYTVDPATGRLSPAGGTPIYYPRDEIVNIVAYYPYGLKGGGKVTDDYRYNISVADQRHPASIDLLWAGVPNLESSPDAVELTFYHVLAKIQLDITLGEGLSGLDADKITAVTLTGMPTTGTFHLLQKQWVKQNTGEIVTRREPMSSSSAAATFTALLIPQRKPNDNYPNRRIVVTVDGTDYSGSIPDEDQFNMGTQYIYPVKVQKTGVTIGTPDIADWTTNDHAPGTATEIGAGIEKVRIPAGTFFMGSPDSDTEALDREKPQHRVTLTRDFWMSKYPITAAQYADFLNAAGVAKADPGSPARHTVDGYGEHDLFKVNQWWTPKWNNTTNRWEFDGNTPMINVTWFGAKAYADWVGGSLPTEAQWEYACRAGTTTAYSFGDDAASLGDYAWYEDNRPGMNGTSPVGTKKPNPWGLYDMHGNVSEWCSDWLGTYSGNAATDPTGPDADAYRGLRGGGGNAASCRSAYRDFSYPGSCTGIIGFRVVFVP